MTLCNKVRSSKKRQSITENLPAIGVSCKMKRLVRREEENGAPKLNTAAQNGYNSFVSEGERKL